MEEYYSEIGFEDNYEHCWETGDYDGQYCACCPHAGECSAGEDDD
ncbi:hypothetical protein [Ruminococcus sp.]|nr:hypothetical protein [Ruminococcus sp.]